MSWQDDPIVDAPTSSPAPQGGGWQDDPVVDPPSIPEAAGHAVVNNLPFGGQMAAGAKSLANDKGYSENLKNWNDQTPIDRAAHPVAYGAGAGVGAIAPLLIPGVGEAMEAAPFAANAALGAADAVSNKDLSEDPIGTAKDAGVGAVIGGSLGKFANKVLPTAEGLQNVAGKKAIESVELPPGIVGRMKPSEREALGKFIQENGLVGRDKAEVQAHARNLSKQFGQKIGEVADQAEQYGLTVDPDTHMGKISDLLAKAEKYKGLANREGKSLARDYTAGASDIVNLSDNPSWHAIQALKENYGRLAFKSNGEVKSEGTKDTYFALKDMLKNIAEKAQSNPNLGADYKNALAGYSQMQPIESGLEKATDAEFRTGAHGHGHSMMGVINNTIKQLPGPARALVGTGAALTGQPHIALAAALPEIFDPAIRSKVASAAATVADPSRKAIVRSGGHVAGLTPEIIDYVSNYMKTKGRK